MEVLIVGGTGFIGRALQEALTLSKIPHKILSRKAAAGNHIFWNPETNQLDHASLQSITHIINLAGAGIAEKRWTNRRKNELIRSRVDATQFLYKECSKHCPSLVGYIGISGVNAFGFDDAACYTETHPFGADFLSQLVAQWEGAHRLFEQVPSFNILRLGMVLSSKGGAYQKIAAPMRFYLGAIPGNGNQYVPWIHLDDVIGLLLYGLEGNTWGLLHGVSNNSSMKELTKTIAEKEHSKILLPNIPKFIIRVLFGEMGLLLTESIRVDYTKRAQLGYKPRFNQLSDLINEKES